MTVFLYITELIIATWKSSDVKHHYNTPVSTVDKINDDFIHKWNHQNEASPDHDPGNEAAQKLNLVANQQLQFLHSLIL